MLVELKDYKWQYENGIVTLVNKKTGAEFPLPISKMDSVSRAFISFRNRYRIEQVEKLCARFKDKVKKLKSVPEYVSLLKWLK